MRAVLLRVRGTFRRGWTSALAVTCIVAVVTAVVLALAAGARRTAAAPDDFTAAVGGDHDAYVEQPGGPPRKAEVAALPGVESVEAMTFTFAALIDPQDGPADGLISFAGSRPSSSRLVAGREPQGLREFVVDQAFAAAHEAQLGDTYRVATLTEEEVAVGDFAPETAEGPSFDAELVGIFQSADVLESEFSVAVFGPQLLELDIPIVTTNMYVDLEPGVTIGHLREQIDRLEDGAALGVEPTRVISSDIRNAVEAQAQGVGLMAVVTAAAAVVALGQLLTRHVRPAQAERDRLIALGYTKGQLGAESIARAAVPASAGVVVGAVLAVVASGWFPTGFVRRLDPGPGMRVDAVALAVGGVVVLAGVLGWVGAASLAAGRTRARQSLPWAADTIARRAPTPAAGTGTRFALTRHDGSSTTIVSQLGLAVLVGGVIGATIFGVSLDQLVAERGQVGSNFDIAAGLDIDAVGAGDLRRLYEDDPDVGDLLILTADQVRVGDATVGLVGVERVRGERAPRAVAGRLPEVPDEVALGRLAASQLDVGVGDTVDFEGPDGDGRYRVVGVAVVPPIAGIDGLGQGGIVTADGLLRLDSDPASRMAAINLRRGAPASARQRLVELVGPASSGEETGGWSMPGAILNVDRVRHIPALLTGLLAALTLLTMIHALIVSIHRRRRDLAVLRALGADRRYVASAVHWQATALAALPLVLGVPLGLIAGSAVFRAFAERIGAVPDPVRPVVVVAATALALVGVANLAAVVPARRARRGSPAQQLRAE